MKKRQKISFGILHFSPDSTYQYDNQSTVQVLHCGQHELRGHGDADHRPHPERAARHHQVHQHLMQEQVSPHQWVPGA